MERYKSYKQIECAWIPEIPAGWEISKVGSHFKQRNEKSQEFFALSVSKAGVVPQMENVALSSAEGDTRKLVRKGDFVVNSRSDRKGSCGVSDYDGTVSLINIVLEPKGVEQKYIHYLFRSNAWIEEFYRNGRGIVADLWTTNYQMMKGMLFPLPPKEEQLKIAAYLDAKSATIDSFISAKQREVELLEEQKQVIIARAVTRGLREDVKMKPTGISWLPEIPEHWDEKRIATHFHNRVESNSDFEFKRAFKFNYGSIVPKDETGDPEEYRDVYVKYSKVKANDIMINGLNLNYDFVSQRVAIVPEDGIITSAYVVMRPFETTYAPYFCYLFKAMDSMKLFHGMGTGIRLTLSFEELKKQFICIPPEDEQKEIVEYIEKESFKLNSLISDISREITLLQEYKQRLISDVVTGQINVQNETV